jgi:hypothetical protein
MMQVELRCLLVMVVLTSAACALNEHGLSGDGGHVTHDSSAVTPLGAAGAGGAPTSGTPGAAGTMPILSGVGGTAAVPTGGSGGATDATGAGGGAIAGAGSTGADAGGTNGAGAAGTNGPGVGGTNGTGAGGTNGAGANGAGAGGSSAAGTAGSTTGAAGMGERGCADGTREGYLDTAKYPRIAACAGGWETPGLASFDSRSPQCDRRGGNDGDRSDGRGCSVADLCASGWSVCNTALSVSVISGGCQDALAPSGDKPVFFVTRQRGTGLLCDPNNVMGTNNLYGCGNIGSAADKTCAPFAHMLRDSDCKSLGTWVCADGPIGTSQDEYDVVTKAGSSAGGVLCCKN